MSLIYSLMIVTLSLCRYADAYPDGAPASTCFTQYPKHDDQAPQTTQCPFRFKFTPEKYQPGQNITIEVMNDNGLSFEGIQTAARRIDGNPQEIVGRFVDYPNDMIQSLDCFSGCKNMITHTNNDQKTNLTLEWKAPSENVGDVRFITTFVKEFSTFWYNVNFTLPVDSNSTITNSTYPLIPLGSLSKPIDFSSCGDTKGCTLYPRTCSGSDCLGAASYQYRPNTKDFLFELHAFKDADYISIGFSEDTFMGDDATMTCTGREGINSVQEGYNPGYFNERHLNIFSKDHHVKYIDGHLQCSFIVPQTLKIYQNDWSNESCFTEKEWDLMKEWFVMLAWGRTMPSSDVLAEHDDMPAITKSKVSLLEYGITYATAFQLLVELHACLMMIAWIFLAGIVTVVARHFKDWLPNSKLCGTKVWFQLHREAAILVFVLTSVGFICIFVHFNTSTIYETANPHAYVGIGTVTAMCLQVLAGMFRPGADSKLRPAFNIGHWLMGHATHILAAATMVLAFNITYMTAGLRRRGFIVMGAWIALQVIWHIVFEIIKMRRSENADDGPLEGKTGKNKFTINSIDDSDSRAKKGATRDTILFCVYIFTLLCMCVASLVLFLLY